MVCVKHWAATLLALLTISCSAREYAPFGWGENDQYQLGLGNNDVRKLDPVSAPAGSLSFSQIYCGYEFSFGLTGDGSVYAWGLNDHGQIGDGTTTTRTTPVRLTALSGAAITQVSAGLNHALALDSSGNVYSWGHNDRGQLGDGTNTDKHSPARISGLSNIARISAGWLHSYAIDNAGNFYTWGENGKGQLGRDGVTTVPIKVQNPGSSPFTQAVAATSDINSIPGVALQADGTVWWVLSKTLSPTLTAPKNVTQICAGHNHFLALTAEGAVYGTYQNERGQLGCGSSDGNWHDWTQVSGVGGSGYLTGIKSVAAGYYSSMALGNDGSVYVWGFNAFGMLDGHDSGDRSTPVKREGVSGAVSVAASLRSNYYYVLCNGSPASVTLAVKPNGAGIAVPSALSQNWGDLFNISASAAASWAFAGWISDRATMTNPEAASTTAMAHNSPSNAVTVTACFNQVAGLPWSWGANAFGQTGNGNKDEWVTEPARTPASLPDLSQAAAGARHSLALTSGGKLYAWGKNDLGQLGNNTTADSLDPVRVLDSSGSGYLTCVSRAAAGFDHNLALRHDGTVWSWGGNVCGQLGNNTRTASPLPVQVLDASGSGYLTDVTQIAAGDCCSMALKSDGSVYAWGGYVQDVNPVLPVKIKEESGSDLGGVTQIAIGGDHCLALKSDGTVRAWGFNMDGQLGNNSTDRKYRAVQVLGLGGSGYLTDVTQVAAGASHSMALKSDGSVYAWGANFFGTLGNNTQTESHVPVQVLDASGSGYLAGVTQISAGFDHSLALKSDGSLWGWGDISSLGVGETGRVQKLPVQSRMSSAVALARGPVAHHAIALKAGLVNLTMAVSKSSYGTTSPEPGTSSVYSHTAHQITATPTGKYSFGNWTVSGGASVANANAASTTVILTADGSVTANFLPPVNLTMLLNPEEGGSVSPGSGTVKIGESFDITVTPADKYSFQKWTCSGGASVTDANSASTRAVLSSEGAITANFNAPPVLIMAVNPAQGGTVSPAAGTSPVTLNQEFDISAAPADKYLFQVWTVSGGASVTNANSTATRAILRSGGKITANFLKPSTLTMAVNPAQSGSVTPAAGTSLVRVGDTFDITATPADKCSFQKWTCSGGASVTDANSATTKATMSAVDGVITANFLPPATLTMSVNPEAGGSASPASGSFRVSESFNITATPADKYTFQKWTCSGGASVANANAASTTAALSSDGAITACFNAPVSLTMAANPAAAGTTSPVSGKSVVPFNTGFAVTATPATAYGFLEWTAAGGASVADTNTASTTATLTADGVITAKFAPLVSLTMGINNSKCGTVSPEKGVHSVAIGKRLAFTASSFDKDRYIFQNWTVSGGVTLADTGSASTTGTVTAEGAVTANFTAYANLTVKNDDGRGNVTPSGTSKVLQDTPISISAAAKDAYAFAGWSCAGAGAVADTWKGSTTVTLTGDCSVTAAFASGDWLTVSPIMMPNNLSGGTTAPNGGVLIPFNSAYPISATPNTGYRFDQWVVSAGDAKVADIGSASTTVTMTSGQSTVLARFKWSPSSDFNADGRSDMIFFNTNGSLVMYYMDGGTLKQWVIPSLGDGEIPIATGDFNGDGCADILTRNTAKDTASVFLMRGTSVLSSAVLTSGVSDWRVAGTGDFNGDGKCDIIWQHTSSGAGVIYLMSGLIYTNWGFVYESSDTANWQIKAVGDLDGDGKADIIWRNKSTGVAKAYLMNGVTVKSSGQIYDGADPKWNIAGAGDLDGDGKADIIWRHSVTGVILGYLMDGLLLKSWAVIYDGSNPNLRFAGVGDYSGEGKTDIALRDIITGNVYIFVMDGLRVTAQNCVYDGGDPNWYVSGQGESSFAILISSASGPGTVTPSAGTHRVALDEPVTIKAVPASASCRFIGWTVSGGGVIASAGSVSTTVTLSGDASVKAWFTAAAVADLNGDGKSDILWRNSSNGSVAGWLMSGARSTDARIIFDSDASWIPAGKADFNGDGKADILWRNSSSGSLALWLMSGLGRTDGIVLPASVSETVAGIGDFNGDGKADILKLASDGAVYMELMNGASVISRTKIFEPGQDWIPCGTGDFDGDGKSDILWRHASGTVAMWLMDGVTAKNGRGIFLDDSQGWRPKACGDFNGDGKCDIVWQDASGNAVVWLMSGFSMTSYGYIFQNGDTAWKIMESGDFDGDGKADILWRNSSTGQTVIYFMNGASVRSWAIIFDGDTNWTVAR